MTEAESPERSSRDDIDRDAADLRRGVAVNLFGYLIKLSQPILLYAVIRLFGSREYGIFIIAQSTLMILLRACLFGFDKGALWWAARQPHPSPLFGMGGVMVRVSLASTVMALLSAWFAPSLASWQASPGAAAGLTLMAVGLVPMALTELVASAAAGKRKMETQVLVRDGFGAILLTLFGVIAYFMGLRVIGLPLAFVASKLVTCVAAFAWVRRLGPFALGGVREPVPAELSHYSLQLWLTEIASSFAQRMDVLALGAMASPEAVGIYGGVTPIANTLRQIRQAFDPLVIAITSEVGVRRDVQRLRAGFSYATSLVVVTQLPIYAFILCFAGWLMSLYGPGFEAGVASVVVLSGFWIINGVIGLNGHILTGLGRSDLSFLNMLLLIAIEAVSLWLLIPPYGITGAAIAVGLAYTLQNLVVAVEARWLSGAWPYDHRVLEVLMVTSLVSLFALTVWWLAQPSPAASLWSFGAFLLAFAAGTDRLYRSGVLYRTRSEG